MPQDTSPWKRRELKRERSEPEARWRSSRSPSYQGGRRFFPRTSEPRRHIGHGKQGGWHLYSEEPGRKFVTSRSYSKTIAMQGDGGNYSQGGYRDSRGLFAPRELRGGQSWEASRRPFSMSRKPPDADDFQRDHHDKRSGASRPSPSPSSKVEEKRLGNSVDWKARKWMNRGCLSSGDSDLHKSSAPKSATCKVERDDESQSKNVSPVSSSEKVSGRKHWTDHYEGLNSNKKPRLGWGEGLAKYEKKKVDGPVASIPGKSVESMDAADGTFGAFGVSDSSSPPSSSTLARISLSSMASSDKEEKPLETMKMSGHIDNLSDLPVSGSQIAHREFPADAYKLDGSSSVSMVPSLVQLIHSDAFSLEAGFSESTSMETLPLIKDDVSKELVKIENEIDLLENELKSITSESRVVDTSSIHSSVKTPDDAESKLCEQILSSNKEHASEASSLVFKNLVLVDRDKVDVEKIGSLSQFEDDSRTKEKFTQRKRFLIFKEKALALKFKTFHYLWQKNIRGFSLSSCSKPWKKLEASLRVKLGGIQKPRSLFRPGVSSPGIMSPAHSKGVILYTRKLLKGSRWEICREALKMPALILDEREKIASRFVSCNGLVEDPAAVEKERMMTNPWTVEERQTFMEKLEKYGKDFRRIASFLEHKTTADCVEFYYKNHKSESFLGAKKKNDDKKAQVKSVSAKTYLVTSGKPRNREVNAVSLDLLSEASLAVSHDQVERSFLRPCSSSKSSQVNTLDDERELVAADVLTKMHSSVTHAKSPRKKDLSNWTDEERSTFVRGVSLYGKDFAMISRYLKTRSVDQCRAFYNKSRKCLGLDWLLPSPTREPLKDDCGTGGDDGDDGACGMKNGSAIHEVNSIANKSQDMLVPVKMESIDAADCVSSIDQKEAAYGSGLVGSRVFEENTSGFSLKSHDLSPCSVFSLSSEFKDQSPVEKEQVEKPPPPTLTDASSLQCAEVEKHSFDNLPELREQSSHDSEDNLCNLQGGDFKLFGKRIVTHKPKNHDSGIHGEEKKKNTRVNLKFTGNSERNGHASVVKFELDNHAILENIPIKSYGYWDGSRVRTIPCLPDSAYFLAKYPAAFSKHPLQEVAESGGFNFNNSGGHSVIPSWDMTRRLSERCSRHEDHLSFF